MGILGNVHGQDLEPILDALNVVSVFSLDKSRMGRTNMSDLISREALLKVIRDDRLTNASDAIYFITNAPAIEQGEPVAELKITWGSDTGYEYWLTLIGGALAQKEYDNWIVSNFKGEGVFKLYTTPQQTQSVADALEEAAKLVESQRFMALDSTKTYTAEEYRQGLKSSVAFLAKQIRKLSGFKGARCPRCGKLV